MDAKQRIAASRKLVAKRLVTAADASDAGQALKLMESVLGPGKANKKRFKEHGEQRVEWNGKGIYAHLILDDEENSIEAYIAAFDHNGQTLYELSAYGTSFAQFKKELSRSVKGEMRDLKRDAADAKERAEMLETAVESISKFQ